MQKKKSGVKNVWKFVPLRGGRGVGPLMANAILNFHFDFLHPSLIRNIDLGFALDLVLYPPVVVVDEEDVDGDRGVDEEGHGEEEDEGILDSFLRFLPAYLIVQAKLQRNKKILSFKFITKVLII